jgi:hypothetical protein
MLCVHGITDTRRTWELVLPLLEARHDVLEVTSGELVPAASRQSERNSAIASCVAPGISIWGT